MVGGLIWNSKSTHKANRIPTPMHDLAQPIVDHEKRGRHDAYPGRSGPFDLRISCFAAFANF
jgi:hypothetical protein